MDFSVDLHRKLRNLKKSIENEWVISNNDVDILIREFEKQQKIIELMSKDISKFEKTKPDEIKKYYEKEARKCQMMKLKKY